MPNILHMQKLTCSGNLRIGTSNSLVYKTYQSTMSKFNRWKCHKGLAPHSSLLQLVAFRIRNNLIKKQKEFWFALLINPPFHSIEDACLVQQYYYE